MVCTSSASKLLYNAIRSSIDSISIEMCLLRGGKGRRGGRDGEEGGKERREEPSSIS